MDARTETPERWFTSGLRRASRVISATISFMYVGTVTVKSVSSNATLSCVMMSISCSTLRG